MTGLVVPPNDPAALGAALRWIASQPPPPVQKAGAEPLPAVHAR